jgi:protein-tyrosine kinase
MSGKVELKSLYATSTDSDSESGAHISRMGEVERFSSEELDQLKLIYAGTSNFSVLNIFRELRTQLLQKQKKKNFVCMVTSTSHNGGASFIASNLASVFALDKAKTSMLIDANLYSPSVDRLVIGDAEIGLTDFLSENVSDIKDVVYATGVPRLRAVPLGGYSEGAAEYFSSTRMAAFIDEVKGRYPDRYIFIDAPPVLLSSESRILAEQVDMVLLVVPHAKTTIDEISSAIDVIGKDKLAGLVYND